MFRRNIDAIAIAFIAVVLLASSRVKSFDLSPAYQPIRFQIPARSTPCRILQRIAFK